MYYKFELVNESYL